MKTDISKFDGMLDTIATHLAKQRGRAVNDSEGCMYRAPGGLMCAFGCLIPNSEITDHFMNLYNSSSASGLPAELLEKLHNMHAPETDFNDFLRVAGYAQCYHDRSHPCGGTTTYMQRLERSKDADFINMKEMIFRDLRAFCF